MVGVAEPCTAETVGVTHPRRIGAIVTAGQEDYLKFERGIQTYLGYPYSDRLHVATHHHNEPLVPRDRRLGEIVNRANVA